MVTRTNGAPAQGFYFSKDVRVLGVTATGGTFLADLTVAATGSTDRQADVINSTLEVVLEAVSTRGTIIGLTVTGATTCEVMVDYAQAFDVAAVRTEVQDLIDADSRLSSAAVTVDSGFAGAALGTPS